MVRFRLAGRHCTGRSQESAPALAILVPAYKEDPDVVRKTLLSAALEEYPNRRVVLLIDDPPEPGESESAAGYAAEVGVGRETLWA